jgi:hypothetical protein
MANFQIVRKNELPAVGSREASTMYIIKAATGSLVDIYFTGDDPAVIQHVITRAEIQTMIDASGGGGGLNNIILVQDIAERDALAPEQNMMALVLDATGDPSVQTGSALYFYDLATTTWYKVSEFESLDVQLEWSKIQNVPVVLTHLSENGEGDLTHNGRTFVLNGEHEW